jgi:hypothetical protein
MAGNPRELFKLQAPCLVGILKQFELRVECHCWQSCAFRTIPTESIPYFRIGRTPRTSHVEWPQTTIGPCASTLYYLYREQQQLNARGVYPFLQRLPL